MTTPARETVLGMAEALKIACAADDRLAKSDDARLRLWSEQAERNRLTADDMLDAVIAFYDGPSDRAITLGDMMFHGKNARRTRVEKESNAQIEHRRAQLDAKAEDPWDMPLPLPMGPVKHDTPRLQAARDALDACYGRDAAKQAIREYLSARVEAVQLAKAAPPRGRQQVATASIAAALAVPCPWETCRAKVGSACVLDGQVRAVPHPSRIEAAQTKENAHA